MLLIIIFEQHKVAYWKTRNQTKKVIAKAMKKEVGKEMEELREKQSKIFKFVKLMKGMEKSAKWIKCRDGRIGFRQAN